MAPAGRTAYAIAGSPELGATLSPERGSFWLIGVVAVANVVLGVWRPRFSGLFRSG